MNANSPKIRSRWLRLGAALLTRALSLALLGLFLFQPFALRFDPSPAPVATRETDLALLATLSQEKCDFFQDEQGIPHVQGKTELSSYACLGYLHGRYRAWQMDYLRRAGQGRRAQVYGPSQLKADFFLKHLRLAAAARDLYERLDSKAREVLVAYAAGANRGFETPEALSESEWSEWNLDPSQLDPWRPEDSLTVLLLESFDQTRRSFELDVRNAMLVKKNPSTNEKTYTDRGLPWETSILHPEDGGILKAADSVSESSKLNSIPMSALSRLSSAWPVILSEGENRGSNSWVVAPSRTKTGHAFLANDPHLDLKRPSFWFWAEVSNPVWDAIGASLPGAPVIASGTNLHVAWGLTNAYLKVGRSELKDESQVDDKRTRHYPHISVKWLGLRWPFFFQSSDHTSEGDPILPIDAVPGKKWVLHWSGLELDPARVGTLFRLVKSESTAEVENTLRNVEVPAYNFVFADTQGAIGYRAFGRVPNWNGNSRQAISPDQMPHLLNPRRGYIATANNRHFPDDARQDAIGFVYSNTLRAHRIEELLQASQSHDRTSLQSIQCDTEVMDADYLMPLVRKVLGEEASVVPQRMRATLDCASCGVYREFFGNLVSGFSDQFHFLYRTLSGEVHPENWDANVSVKSAWKQASEKSEVRKPWGEIHRAPFEHLSGASDAKHWAIATPGDDYTVNVGSSRVAEKEWGFRFKHTTGVSQRMIVELKSPPEVYAVLAGSNSGQEDSESSYTAWRDCQLEKKHFPLNWSQVSRAEISLKSEQEK